MKRAALAISAAVAIIACLLVNSFRFADAANINLLPKNLLTSDLPLPTVNAVLATATFTAPNNTLISTGTNLDTGGSWVVHSGTWRVTGNRAKLYTATVNASMTVNTANVNVRVADTLTINTTATTRKAGVVVHRTSTGAFLYVLYENAGTGTITLYESNGSVTTLASASGIGNVASVALTVDSTSLNQIIVKSGSTTLFTYNLSVGQVATYKTGGAGSRQGIISNNDISTRHDNFRVEQL